MFKRFEFVVTVRFADQNIALKCEAQPENHFILKLLSRKKEKKKPGNVSRSCKCDGMSWTYAGLSFIHLILPPASCCVWINKRHHGNWNCPKKKKEKKNTIKTRWLHASASRRRSGEKKPFFARLWWETSQSHTLLYMCIIREYECTCNQPRTQRMEEHIQI